MEGGGGFTVKTDSSKRASTIESGAHAAHSSPFLFSMSQVNCAGKAIIPLSLSPASTAIEAIPRAIG